MEAMVQNWLQQAKKNAGWLVVLGIVEVVAGVLAILGPLAMGLAVTLMVGIMLLVAGVVRIIGAFKAESFGGGALTFLWGMFLAVAGFRFVTQPGLGLASLTLLIATVLFADGVVRIVLAFHMRPVSGWGWMLAGGILSILFATMIWGQFPVSGIWVIGTLVGVSLISNGFTTIFVASAARKVAGIAAGAR
jgi:uncharacterized membrane protein HdeD (DUF308 family)